MRGEVSEQRDEQRDGRVLSSGGWGAVLAVNTHLESHPGPLTRLTRL